jgi:hypothetical protein
MTAETSKAASTSSFSLGFQAGRARWHRDAVNLGLTPLLRFPLGILPRCGRMFEAVSPPHGAQCEGPLEAAQKRQGPQEEARDTGSLCHCLPIRPSA